MTSTTINVRVIGEDEMITKALTFDKPFDEITASEIMSRLNCSIAGWTESR